MQTERRFDIDWLRIILILSVFLFHVGMIFNGWGWHIKNNVKVESLNPVMSFLHYWRMPLLYFISGVGTYFALRKRGIGKYVKERHLRLGVPFVLGIFILVAPQVYVERIDQYKSYIDFYPHFFEGTYPSGNFSWHHLWFILYLLIYSMLGLPFFILMKSRYGIRINTFLEKLLNKKGAFTLLLIPVFLSQVILRPFFPDETHALYNDWAYFTYNFIYFIYGFILLSSKNLVLAIYKQRHLHLILGILATISMYNGPDFFRSGETKKLIWDISSVFLSWFLSLSILGYAQKYLNVNNKFRKYANEAIYPFYLLHQPVIIIIGYNLINLEMNILLKALILIVLSLIIIVSVYMVIRKINVLRFIFGMRTNKNTIKNPKESETNEINIFKQKLRA